MVILFAGSFSSMEVTTRETKIGLVWWRFVLKIVIIGSVQLGAGVGGG